MKLISYSFLTCLLILSMLSLPQEAKGQFSELDPEESRRFSISVNAGYALPFDGNRGLFMPNYDVQEVDGALNFGGNIKYAFTPFWDFGLEYRYLSIEGSNPDFMTIPDFETEGHSIGIVNQMNLNRLFRSRAVSETLNPYLSLGIGIDAYTYENLETGADRSDEVPYVRPGVGLAVSLTEGLDIYGQFDYHFGDSKLDNIRSDRDHTLATSAIGGIRYHFGSSGEQKYRNAPATRFLNEEEHEDFLEIREDAEQISQMNERLNQQEQQISEMQDELMTRNQELEDEVSRLNNEVDDLHNRIQELENRLEDVDEDVEEMEPVEEPEPEEIDPEEILGEFQLEDGYYIQLMATQDDGYSLEFREEVVAMLEDRGMFDDPNMMVLSTQRRNELYFEVRIGAFEGYSEALNAFNELEGDIPGDSFIVLFPRPQNLIEEHYYDIDVHDELEDE